MVLGYARGLQKTYHTKTFENFQSFGFSNFSKSGYTSGKKMIKPFFLVKQVKVKVQAKFNQNRSVCIRHIHI